MHRQWKTVPCEEHCENVFVKENKGNVDMCTDHRDRCDLTHYPTTKSLDWTQLKAFTDEKNDCGSDDDFCL